MAIPGATQSTFPAAAVSEITVPVPSDHASGDVLVVILTASNGARTFSQKAGTTGWTQDASVTGGPSMSVWTKKTTGSESDPVFTISAVTFPAAACLVIKDPDGTTWVDAINTASASASGAEYTYPALTTTTAGCLGIFASSTGSSSHVLHPQTDQVPILQGAVSVNTLTVSCAPLLSNGLQTAPKANRSTQTAASTSSIVIAIRNTSGGRILGGAPIGSTASTMLSCVGNTETDISSLVTSLDGNTPADEAYSVNTSDLPFIPYRTPDGDVDLTKIFRLNEAGVFAEVGRSLAFNATQDLSDGTPISCLVTTGGLDDWPAYADGGLYFGLTTGATSAARVWKVTAGDTKMQLAYGVFPIVVDPTITTGATDFGTVDLTDVRGFFLAGTKRSSGTLPQVYFSMPHKIGTLPLIGGTSGTPITFAAAHNIMSCSGYRGSQNQIGQSGNQYFMFGGLQLGDGSSSLYFKGSNQSVELPSAASETEKNVAIRLSAGAIPLTIYAAAGNSIDLSSLTINFGNFHTFTEHASTSDTDIYNYQGLNLLNADVTLQNKSNIDRKGLVCTGCKAVTHNSGSLSGVTISNVATGETAAIDDITSEAQFGAVVTGATFNNNTNAPAIRITGNQSHTGSGWDDPGLTVSGNTIDIEYTGATNFSIQSATSLTVSNTGAGVLTIVTPVVQLEVTSNIAGSDIKIFNTGTQTIAASATGTTASISTAATYDWTVQKAGYLPQRGTGVVLGTTSSVTVDVELVEDPVYNSSHGLTFTTDYSYNPTTRVMTIVANQEGRDLYSALIDDFISQTSLRNYPFPLKAVGPDRIDFISDGTTGATIDSGDIQYWKGAGMQWEHDTTGNPTKKFYSIKSSNTLQASSVVGYTQTNTGTPVEATLVSNQVNQVIQFYEDTNGDGSADYDRKTHLLFKGFLTGFYQARWDVINNGGITELEPYEYTISLTQEAIAGTTGDQAVTITTLTDHSASPLAVGGKNFNFELVDPGTNTAAVLLAQHNYNVYNAVNTSISGALYTSYQAFDLPDLIVEAGSNYETEAGYFEGEDAVTDREGVYLSRGGSDHPDINAFQSNDLSDYVPDVTANGTITGLVDAGAQADDRLQIENTTALSAADWQASTAYSAGDIVKRTTGLGTENTAGLFFRAKNGGTSGGIEPTWVITTPGVFGTAGSETTDNDITWECFSVLLYDADPAATSWSDSYIDGEEFASGETGTYRFAEMDEGTTFKKASATFITTSAGFTVSASSVLEANSVFAENAIDGSAQDSIYSPNYNADGATDYIVMDTNTDFRNPKTFAYYCYLLTTSEGMYNLWDAVTAIDAGNYRNNVDIAKIMFDETAGFVKQEDSDNSRWFNSDGSRPFLDPTTGGAGIHMNWKNPVYVTEVNTGSAVNQATVQAALTAQGYTTTRAPHLDKAGSLTFTVAGQVDSNCESMNGHALQGDGSESDKIRTVNAP